MSLFTKLLKKSIRDFLNKRKKWLIIITVIFGLLISIHLIVNHYVDKVVGTLIKEFVHEKSNGFYKIEFDEISYLLNNRRFYMSNFKFDIHPDLQEKITYEELTQKYLYGAAIPVLHIDIIDFWSIFVNRKLRVIGVEVDNPYIKVINLNKNKNPKKISFEAGNLYEVLSGHLNELKINDFKIKDGEFDYETYQGPDYDNFKIKGLTFEVNNFQLNEKAESRTDKFFYTDDIFLEIRDQVFFLKDSIHKITFDRFYISTSDNEFGFEKFNLTRRKDPHSNVKSHDHYEISLPILRLAGIDFISAYNDNLLNVDSILILDPTINIKKRNQKQTKDSSRHSILDAAMIYHDYLKIENFDLVDAHLIYTDETKDISKQYSIDHISSHITDVEIDTGRYSKYRYGFNFNKADLMVKDYEVNLPDSLNTVKFSEFSISSDPFEIKLKDLNIQPNSTQNKNINKSQFFATVPYMVITEFDVAKAINLDTFLINEIYLENPELKIIPANNNNAKNDFSPAGLFGVYAELQSMSDYFSLKKFNVVNGNFQMEHNSAVVGPTVKFDELNILLEDLKVDSATNLKDDLFGGLGMQLDIKNGIIGLPKGNINIQKLNYGSDWGRLQIDSLQISADSTKIGHDLQIHLPKFILTGINPNEILFKNRITVDSLLFQDFNVKLDLLSEKTSAQDSSAENEFSLPLISINHLLGIDYDLDIRENGLPLFFADNINFDISRLLIDQSLSDNLLNQFDYSKINNMSVDNYDYYLTGQNHIFHSDKISWENRNSTLSMRNIALKPFGKSNNQYDIEVPKITMSGIDLKKVLKESYYEGNEILIDQPKLKLKLAQGRQEKMTSLDLGYIPFLLRNRFLGAKASMFKINDADIDFHQKIESDSLIFEVESFNLLVDNFDVDSTTEMVPDRFLFANDVQLNGDYLSLYHQQKSDFYNINHYHISTKEKNIRLNGLYYSSNTRNEFPEKGQQKIAVDNLNLLGFDFFNLTQNSLLEIDEIQVDNADISISNYPENELQISQNDSMQHELDKYGLSQDKSKKLSEEELLNNISQALEKELLNERQSAQRIKDVPNLNKAEYLFDTALLKNLKINRIVVADSRVKLATTDDHNTGLEIPEIWAFAEGIKYNPVLAKDSSRIFYSDNIMARVINFNYVLPDNLSSVHADELSLDSKDSTIKAINFALIPLVSRYDFGPAKGYQATWLQVKNDSIILKNVDFLGIINKKQFNAQSLNVHGADVSVFRDKRIEFPEWQRRPLPQTSLRGLNATFAIDTINLIDGYISYQEHSEKAYTTGEVFFSDLNAKIINLTNDSIRTLSYPSARIGVTSKIFGEGEIKGEFLFDLVDMENIHSYGFDVEPFDLTEFNRILVPSASVQIASGENKRIIMNAKANEYYSYGEMKFYYNNLKIQLLNRETETPKGLGNALGSFFANTFIIKSNNPRNLFLRKGDIFFERDEKRAIFNYWTKTFLSGVVSSIGATNNKKKIKKMQDENLKKIQVEKETQSSL